MEEEHFVTSNFLSLLEGRATPTEDLEAEASHQEQASRASPASSTPTSGDSSSAPQGPGRGERGIHPVRLPPLRKGTSSTSRVWKIGKKGIGRVKSTPGAQVEDFIPWVRSELNRPFVSEEKEEEEEMTGLFDRYTARK